MTQKVVIAAFLEPKDEGFQFSKWPNHITIVPYFRTNDLEVLIAGIRAVGVNAPHIQFKVGEVDYFGPRKLRVNVVEDSDGLISLHRNLFELALSIDSGIDTRHCYPNFRPHITHNKEPFPKEGQTLTVDRVYLIKDLSEHTKDKEIVAVVGLK